MKRSQNVLSRSQVVSKRIFAAMLASASIATLSPSIMAQETTTPETKEVEVTSEVANVATTNEVQIEAAVPGAPPTADQVTAEVETTGTVEVTAEKVAVAAENALGKFWLGLGLKKVEGDLATYLGSDAGMLIFEIYPESPASKAEWKTGDILLSFNGKDVSDFETLLTEISAIEAKSAKCVLLRKGEKVEEEITPEARPENVPQIESAEKNQTSWTFESLPLDMLAAEGKDAKGVMLFRAIPGMEGKIAEGNISVFQVDGKELKLPEGALKAIPRLEGALKSLKNIEVTQVGKGIEVTVDAERSDGGEGAEGVEAKVKEKNISVSVIRKSEEDPGTFTVTIDGEKFEGTMDKVQEAPEKVRMALENVTSKDGAKSVTLPNGARIMIAPGVAQDKSKKEIEVILKMAEEAAQKAEGKATATIVTGEEGEVKGEVKKNMRVIIQHDGEGAKGDAKPSAKTETSKVTKTSRIVIASEDDNGELKVMEFDGDVTSDAGILGHIVINGEQLKAAAAGEKRVAGMALREAKAADGKVQLRLHAANAAHGDSLKKEIAELRATIEELKKQIEELKK